GGRATRVQVYYPTDAAPDCATRYTVNNAGGSFQLTSPLCAAVDAAPATGPFPLIVFDHGGGVAGADHQRFAFLPLPELLATHGFIVAVALHSADPVNRIKDLSLLTDKMLARNADSADLFYGRIDPARIGASGFSAGGTSSFNDTSDR